MPGDRARSPISANSRQCHFRILNRITLTGDPRAVRGAVAQIRALISAQTRSGKFDESTDWMDLLSLHSPVLSFQAFHPYCRG